MLVALGEQSDPRAETALLSHARHPRTVTPHLTSKIHLACDGRGRSLAFLITAGNRNDCTQAEAVISKIRVPGPGSGRPRTRPDHVVADKGYSSRTFRAYLRRRGIKMTIPERVDQLAGRKRRRERPCGFDKTVYRRRNVVERCFHRLKQWRGIATRTTNAPTATSPPLPSPAPSSGSTHDRRDTP